MRPRGTTEEGHCDTIDHPLIDVCARQARRRVSRGFSIEPSATGRRWAGSTPARDNATRWYRATVAFCATWRTRRWNRVRHTLASGRVVHHKSLTINFFRPVWKHACDSTPSRHRSKNTGYLECDVTDPEGKLIAKASRLVRAARRPAKAADRLWLRGLYLSQESAAAAANRPCIRSDTTASTYETSSRTSSVREGAPTGRNLREEDGPSEPHTSVEVRLWLRRG